MAWIETDYSEDTHLQWKIKWRQQQHMGVLGIMGKIAPLKDHTRGTSEGDSAACYKP